MVIVFVYGGVTVVYLQLSKTPTHDFFLRSTSFVPAPPFSTAERPFSSLRADHSCSFELPPFAFS